MGKFLFFILFFIFSFGANGQVPSIKGQDDTTKMYPVNYEVPGKKAIKLNSTTVLIDTDQDNLLVNGGFEAQDVTLGWVKSTATSIDFIDSGAFEGKKSRAIRFGDTVSNYRTEANRPEYVGRQARAEIYYKSDITWGAEVPEICVYAGTASNVVSGTCEPLQNTGTQWYPYQKGFFWSEAVMGLVIRNNGAIDLLNSVYLDKASIKLDKNEGFVANIEGDYQQVILRGSGSLAAGTNLDSYTKSNANGNATLFTLSTEGVSALRDIAISITVNTQQASSTVTVTNVLLNGVFIARNVSGRPTTGQTDAQATFTMSLSKGDKITFQSSSATENIIQIRATARSQVTVFPDETFSTDINPVYWKSTACLENEVGCYNTFAYDASNNRTMCGTRPTPQTDADIRINGFRVYTRNHNVASSCATPVAFRVMMPKNLSNPSETLFKDTTRAVVGGLDLWGAQGIASMYGAASKNYNPSTGTYDFDSGEPLTSTVTAALFRFIDRSTQNNGYLVIKASKTGLGMANVPARYPVKFIESGSNWATVYNDGWVEQRALGVSQSSGGGTGWCQLITLSIAMMDSNYSVAPNRSISDTALVMSLGAPSSTTQVNACFRNTSTGTSIAAIPNVIAEGWGASSVVKQYGANPAY